MCILAPVPDFDIPAFSSALARWFGPNHRELPWRATRDPYAIWVSEIMLQQTRVDTVCAYFEPFLARFPTVQHLAEASTDAVMGAWSGLGYYRRARLLHAGAQDVVARFGGRVPGEPALLRSIPGIGPYTAGAIASIAFNTPAALVDGNVARVLSRMGAIEDPRQQAATARGHWKVAQSVVESGQPRVLAQAMMELGAVVCTPQQPRCGECPVRAECHAFRADLTATIPSPKRKAPSPVETLDALVVRWGRRLLLERRPATGLLADMWVLPTVPRPARAPARVYGEALGVAIERASPMDLEIKHVFTHRVWKLRPVEVFGARRPRLRGGATARCWLSPGERPTSGGTPTVTEKLLEVLGH